MSGILTLLMGRTLCDRYRVDSVIGAGGMGAVCRAYDSKLDREVAIKVMTAVVPDPAELERLRGRFYREARAAARLRHPNVVTVHDFGTDPSLGIDFLVMELLMGEDLAARMRRAGGPLPAAEALEILREAAMGLAAGHRVGLVHRDVKPGNLYLVAERGGWEVKVLDFGIAQLDAPGDGTMTRLTVAAAPHTPRYASPEQLRGDRALTPATDVYSLALTAVEMLLGGYPEGVNTDFTDRAAVRALKNVVTGTPGLSLAMASVLRRALRWDRSTRYPDAGALVEALEECGTSPTVPVPVTGGWSATVEGGPDRTTLAPPADRPSPLGFAAPLAGAAPPAPAPTPAPPAHEDAPGAAPPPARPGSAFWLSAAGVAVLLALSVLLLTHGPPGSERDSGPRTEQEWPGAATEAGLAREEAQRVRERHDAREGDTLWVVVLASFDATDIAQAREVRDRLRERGHEVGLANSLVYPEMRDGYVALVAGPYERGSAQEELERLRASIAGDAFLKRVTLDVP